MKQTFPLPPVRIMERVGYAISFAYERRTYSMPRQAPVRFDVVALIETALIVTIRLYMGNCLIELVTEIDGGECAILLLAERRWDGCPTIFPVGKRLEPRIKEAIRDALRPYLGNCVMGMKIHTKIM